MDMERSIKRFGLTEVFSPVGGSEVDVVLVHGINGHPFKTWTSEKHRTFWPAQLLPPFIEEAKARVLVYGFDADTVLPVGEIASSDTVLDRNNPPRSHTPLNGIAQDKIHNHAEHLVATLCANRRTHYATNHPIVFVAHSLGGIVVKRALIYSTEKRGRKTEHLRSIAVSTYGILFLGTPHFGYDTAKWTSWSLNVTCATLNDGSQSRLLEALKPNSETLQNIDRQFVELTSDFHIFYFHEMKPTKLGNGWQYFVDEVSAAPVIQDVERAGIQQDHSHMCTFDTEDTPGFALVTDAIQRYAIEAPEPIRQRWVMESEGQHLRLLGGIPSGVAHQYISNLAVRTSDTLPTGSHTVMDDMNPAKPQLKKHYLVPWDRVKNFVGREAQLKEVAAYFAGASTQQPRVLVLHALGGQGKSQIVLEYCQRWRQDYQGVFWVNATSRSLALQSYTRIATALSTQPQAKAEDDEQVVETIKNLLEDWNESWLLVFDNYDKPDEFGDVRRFFPRGKHGHVIITSRRRDLDRLGDLMELGSLSSDEGVKLLLRDYNRQEIDENLETAKEIIWRLGGLALAIDQAGAYIAHRRITPHDLHEFLEQYEAQRKEIMSFTPSSFWEYGSMQTLGEENQTKAINAFTTWEISMKQLIRDNPHQKDAIVRFLRLSAYFNPARIEELLFRNYWATYQDENDVPPKSTPWRKILKSIRKKKKSQQSNVNNSPTSWLRAIGTRSDVGKETSSHQRPKDEWDSDQFWDLLTKIHNLSLVQNIEKDTQGASFSLHPMVRDWLQHRGQLGDHKLYLFEVFTILESTVYVYWKRDTSISLNQKAALVAHIDACMLNDEHLSEPQDQIGYEEASYGTASALAYSYYISGRFDPAEILLRRITKNELAHFSYFTQLSDLLLQQGKNEQVLELDHRCQQYGENTLDERSSDRLEFTTALSRALAQLGRYDEAERLQWKILRLKQEIFGASDATRRSMCDLAFSLFRQSKYVESEALAREALKLCEFNLHEDDDITLHPMHHLALALGGQSRFEEAETVQRKVAEGNQHRLGKEHPETLASMHNLAWILQNTKKDEAEELYRSVIPIRKKILRKGHPNTLGGMKNLAVLLQDSGRTEEAAEIEQEIADLESAAESGTD
ncbi:MAG: hypothetical protein Q9226_004982 [Calogaya cf. arnoldii]